MLSTSRKAPHCRTCGHPMKGHKMALCQPRSLSEESTAQNYSDVPTPSVPTEALNRLCLNSSPQILHYPKNPISPEPSWEAPPEGTFFHRRNPHIANPVLQFGKLHSPFQRAMSWVSTEKADDDDNKLDEGDDDGDLTPTQSFSTVTNYGRHPLTTASSGTPPLTSVSDKKVDIVVGSSNNVLGIDLSSLVRTNADANKQTTIFVSAALGAISINLTCLEPSRRETVANEGTIGSWWTVRGGNGSPGVEFWAMAFFVVVMASTVAAWLNSGVGQL